MPATRFPALCRREFLQAGGAFPAAAAVPPAKAAEPAAAIRLTPAPAHEPLLGGDAPETVVLAFQGTAPSPRAPRSPGRAVPGRRAERPVAPGETVEVAFVADNPGGWMLHCHVIDHQVSGLMTVIRIA